MREQPRQEKTSLHSISDIEKKMMMDELDVLIEGVERMYKDIKPLGWFGGMEGVSDDEDIKLKIKLFHLLAWVRFLLDHDLIKDRKIKPPEHFGDKNFFNATLRNTCNGLVHRYQDWIMKYPVLTKNFVEQWNPNEPPLSSVPKAVVYTVRTNRHEENFEVGCLIETLKI